VNSGFSKFVLILKNTGEHIVEDSETKTITDCECVKKTKEYYEDALFQNFPEIVSISICRRSGTLGKMLKDQAYIMIGVMDAHSDVLKLKRLLAVNIDGTIMENCYVAMEFEKIVVD
jgi:hypothetical protein